MLLNIQNRETIIGLWNDYVPVLFFRNMALSLHCQHGKKLNVECSIFLLLIDLNDFPLLNIKDIRLNFHCFSSFLIIFNKHNSLCLKVKCIFF